ncbi:MAG TPA: TolC family protein [Blastocatellia bacterium]|nr:TolC family protein [Blastocatellia bacterium]
MKSVLRSIRALAAVVLAVAIGLPLSVTAQGAGEEGRQEGIIRQVEQKTAPASSAERDEGKQSQQPPGTQSNITQPLALSPDVTDKRVGVREGDVVALTMQDSVAMALRNNLDIEVFRQSVEMAQYSLFALRGYYDITSGSSIGYRSSISAATSAISGGGATGDISNKSLFYNFTTTKQVERTGGNYLIEFDNARGSTSNTFSNFTSQYNTTLTLSYTQPLMRNFAIDQNRRSIQIARRSLDLSDSQFRQKVIDVITATQRAYWDLVFAIRSDQIARDAVELTKTQLDNNRKQVEAGTMAPIDLRSTEAALESRKGDVINALQTITTAENTLKGLLLKDPADKMWYSAIVPTDEPQFGQPSLSLEEASALAVKNRPELEQLKLQAEQNQIDIKYYRSMTRPQLDLVGSYTTTGLAGTPSTGGGIGGLPREVLPRFNGGYGQSLRNLFTQDFRTYQVSVVLSFPWRNRTAEANLGSAVARSRQLDAQQRQLVQTVQVDLRNTLQAVQAARQRYEAARANRIAARAQLDGEQEKFRAGLSTNFFVLDRQNALAVARGNEVRALTDYNKALADLQRATGMTLVSNNVQVTAIPTK